MTRITFWLGLLFAVVGIAAGGDLLVGWLSDIKNVRVSARQFREEAAHLLMPTQNLVPNVDHLFVEPPNADRPDGTTQSSLRAFRTDHQGLILGHPVFTKTGARKILFLGGSTTECNEIAETLRFPAVAAKTLQDAGVDAVTINAGVRGHTTLDSINSLLNRAGFRNADVIVLMENINDRLRLALQGSYDARLGTAAPSSGTAVQDSALGLMAALWDYASYRSNSLFILRLWAERWQGRTKQREVTERTLDPLDATILKHRAEYEENIRIFVNVVRALGKQPVLMTQPLGRHSRSQDVFNDTVREVARREQVLLIDLDRELDLPRYSAFLSDNIHLNEAGSVRVGQLIANLIAPLLNSSVEKLPRDETLTEPARILETCRAAPDSGGKFSPGPIRKLVDGRYPSFSPDGRLLLFQVWQEGRERIRAIDWNSKTLLELSPDSPEISERHPAFLSYSEHDFEIVFGASSGGDTTRERLTVRRWPSLQSRTLFEEALNGSIPAVRNGTITFAGPGIAQDDRTPDLHVYDSNEKSFSRLTRTPWEEWRPAVGADGTTFFIANREGNFHLYSIRKNTEATLIYGSSADEWDPALSPDDRWIAFASKQNGNWDLFLIDRSRPKIAVQLTHAPSDDWDPAFHPSGRLLVFAASTGSAPNIYAMCPFGER